MKLYIPLILLFISLQASSGELKRLACFIYFNNPSVPNLCEEYLSQSSKVIKNLFDSCKSLEFETKKVQICPGIFGCKDDLSTADANTFYTTWLNSDDPKKIAMFAEECSKRGNQIITK